MKITKLQKLVYLIIGVACLMLGVIGLVIPIIPGVLFLMAALYLLSRGSRRIKKLTEQSPRVLLMRQRIDQFGEINVTDRVKLAGWMTMDAAVKSVQFLGNGMNRAGRLVGRRVSSF
jgi:uncharacterized membrane protein YbaN (DUF454 family)